MLAAAVIVFREALEAALVISIVLAATTGVAGSRRWVSYGIVAGIAGAVIVAAFADQISDAFGGSGQELFNAVILFTAVAMLAWHNIWMQRHGKELARHLGSVAASVRAGGRPLSVLAIVVGAAVLREGAETVLFLYGILVGSSASEIPATLLGGVIGLGIGAVVGALLYLGLLRIPSRYLFSVTSIMVSLLAAGLAAQGVAYLAAAGIIPGLGATLWDSSWLLSESSLPGRLLHTLIGYIEQPTSVQLAVYLATLIGITLAARLVAAAAPAHRSQQPQKAAGE
ncbi:MAG TPA: FTR1 family protein [Ferrovibrio sp.]|uniref:FTR1 family iron permease n=1 Tax=Ferrovibrio sp. TaxID=1917215 RepID=UPI002ED5254A